MHNDDLPKWFRRDALALFVKEMGLTPDELDQSEWTDPEEFIDPCDKNLNWEKITSENWQVTVGLKAYIVWIGFTDRKNPDSDTYLWRQVCQGCGTFRDSFSERMVEVQGKEQTFELPLCNRICAPDFWDDGPGEWITLEQAHTPDEQEKPVVRLKDWMCEHCSSVCPHEMMELAFDTDYDPPSETIVCSVCQRKEPERFLARP